MPWITHDMPRIILPPLPLLKRREGGEGQFPWTAKRDQQSEAEEFGRRPILIVEDNADGRMMLEDLLLLEGYEVVSAPNGREALELLHRGVLPSLILLDLSMPEMSGWEFRERQRQIPAYADIPVIVMSAVATRSEAERSNLDAIAFLDKPVPPALLTEMIRKFV